MTTDSNQGGAGDDKDRAASPVDLSELKDLNFGPDWGSSHSGGRSSRDKSRGGGGPNRGGSAGGSRDRRPARPDRRSASGGGNKRSREDHRSGSGSRGRGPRREEAPFKPTVEVLFYPEDEPFKVLGKAIRNSYRTYELFEIARLILHKPERFVVVVRPWGGKGKEATVKTHLYESVPDGLPFESEEEAVSHVLANHLDRFFDTEEVEVDPPSGNFPFVNRCTVTGELLGPPNYHRYQEFLQQHYSSRISNLSMERYQQKIETVRDEEVVQAWLDKMKKVTRYIARDVAEGEEPKTFDSLDSARRYLMSHRKEAVVVESESVRLHGSQVEQMPQGNLRRSIESALEQQRRFPLDTANQLRGRLRRMKFHIYKKGSKGISFVCAVKRKFRDPKIPLADSADRLISFIEKHPNIQAADLPEKFLGLKREPVEVKVPSAPAAETEADKADTDGAAGNESIGQETTAENQPESESREAKPEDSPQPETARPAEKTETQMRYPETQELRMLKQDLHWLVSEGYVTEYGDGRLFAPPPLEASKPEKTKAKETKSKVPEKVTEPVDSPSVPTPTAEGDSVSDAPDKMDKPEAVTKLETEDTAPVKDESAEKEKSTAENQESDETDASSDQPDDAETEQRKPHPADVGSD